jgi:hypothetical protein
MRWWLHQIDRTPGDSDLEARMGSYELARDYFDKAAAANPPPQVRARVEQYLGEIEKGQSRHHLSGYLSFGGQYQSDANLAGGAPFYSDTAY